MHWLCLLTSAYTSHSSRKTLLHPDVEALSMSDTKFTQQFFFFKQLGWPTRSPKYDVACLKVTQLSKFERFVRSEFRLKEHFRWLFQESWKTDQHLFHWASFFLLFSKETEDENNGNKILNNEQVWLRAVKQSFSWPLNQFPLHLHENRN